ncbi:hypothetical protein PHLCEN_2v2367 [Hermanssonia centrifuga]|uniref:Uncharacterized protein n=1 Tax=Hermanssonia centrifuga TaxID=98765 RepID=A0A2R6RM34_9APHY|nr:hypothetical protein PHLCEN_2v2367 [Hermanssonia centrifuga]
MLTHPNVNLAANLLAECTVVADNIRRVVIIPQGFTGVVEDNALAKMFGNSETPIVASNGVCQAFLDSVDWVRKQSDTNHCAILVLRRRFKVIALLLGYSAPLVVLPHLGTAASIGPGDTYQLLSETYLSYNEQATPPYPPGISPLEFDYLAFDHRGEVVDLEASLSAMGPIPATTGMLEAAYCHAVADNAGSGSATSHDDSVFDAFVSLVLTIPPHDLFDKHIAVYSHDSQSFGAVFFALRALGDISRMHNHLHSIYADATPRTI